VTDFRDEVVAATARRLSAAGQTLAESDESGCASIAGGDRLLWVAALLQQLFIVGGVLSAVAFLVLVLAQVLWPPAALVGLCVVLGFLLLWPLTRSAILRAILRRRAGTLAPPGLPQRAVVLEEGSTFKKLKAVPEDFTVCALDAQRRQLLLEGCAYRYRICARDVLSVQLAWYVAGGVRLVCRIAGQPLDVVLVQEGVGGFGVFAPQRLARAINRTLFDADATRYERPEPPVLICAECGRSLLPTEVIRFRDRVVCAACKPVFLQRLREGAQR